MEFEGICIMTADVPRLAGFYRELFETTSTGNDRHTTLTIGGLGLALWHPGAGQGAWQEPPQELRRQCCALIFASADVDATCRRAVELGAAVQELPADQPWGVRACVLNDPDGNRIDIVSKK